MGTQSSRLFDAVVQFLSIRLHHALCHMTGRGSRRILDSLAQSGPAQGPIKARG